MQEATSVDYAVVGQRTIFKFPGDDTKSVACFQVSMKQHLPNTITCDTSDVKLFRATSSYKEWKAKSDAQIHALLSKPTRETTRLQQIYLTQETEMTPTRLLFDYMVDGALQVLILLPSSGNLEDEDSDEETSAREFEWTAVTRQQQLSHQATGGQAAPPARCACCNKVTQLGGGGESFDLHPVPVPVLFIRALHAAIERHWLRSSRVLEIKCRFWIASILSWTCSELLEGPMEIETRERIISSTLAHFDHVIRTSQGKVIGVVHTTRGVERGLLHARTACNFTVLTEEVQIVHAIVTDFITWAFVRYDGHLFSETRVACMEPSGDAGILALEGLAVVVGLICCLAQE